MTSANLITATLRQKSAQKSPQPWTPAQLIQTVPTASTVKAENALTRNPMILHAHQTASVPQANAKAENAQQLTPALLILTALQGRSAWTLLKIRLHTAVTLK